MKKQKETEKTRRRSGRERRSEVGQSKLSAGAWEQAVQAVSGEGGRRGGTSVSGV